jgi:hypothetical protein
LVVLGLLFCRGDPTTKATILYEALQDKFAETIHHSDNDWDDVLEAIVYQSCYHLPSLFEDYGGKLTDDQKLFKTAPISKQSNSVYKVAINDIIEEIKELVFDINAKVTR